MLEDFTQLPSWFVQELLIVRLQTLPDKQMKHLCVLIPDLTPASRNNKLTSSRNMPDVELLGGYLYEFKVSLFYTIKFQANQDYVVKSCFKNKTKQKRKRCMPEIYVTAIF